MRTLIKHTPKKATIEVLKTICVKDGIATATDIDFVLSHPTTASNGLYSPIGFGTPLAKKVNDSIADFPIDAPLEGESVVQNHNPATLLEQLTLLASVMSKDSYSYYLEGVYFHNNKMVATNGHILQSFTHNQPSPKEGVIVPAQTVHIMIDLLKEAKQATIATLAFYENRIIFKIADYTLTSKIVEGTYPDYERSFAIKTNSITPFVAYELQDIKKDIATLAKQAGEKTICVKLENKTLTYKGQSFPISCNITGCFNFNYLLVVPSGLLHFDFTDSRTPVIIKHKFGSSVIMPMKGDI